MAKQLLFILLTIFCVAYQTEASSKDVKNKFQDEEIVPDVLDDLPQIKKLKINYPSGVSVNLGNILTPTQVQDQPTVEWDADVGSFYTLLMTGELESSTSSKI